MDIDCEGCNQVRNIQSKRQSNQRLTWNNSLTLWLVLADVSMKWQDHFLACSSPSRVVNSRDSVSSHLLPTSIKGTLSNEP